MTPVREVSRTLEPVLSVLDRMRKRLSCLGVSLGFHDADAQSVCPLTPDTRADGSPCPSEQCRQDLESLVRLALDRGASAWTGTAGGCRLMAVPIQRRRRCQGVLTACFPPGGQLGLPVPGPQAEAKPACTAPCAPEDATLQVLQWLFEAEQAAQVAHGEISNLSDNLATTYEELSLLYRISAQMKVTQEPEEFLRGLCRDLREVMQVQGVVAVLEPHQATGDRECVVMDGDLDLNAQQVRMIQSLSISPRLEGSQPLIDHEFEPPAGLHLPQEVRNLVAVALLNDTKTMGVLIGINKPEADFDSVDVKLVHSVANQASVFLANRQLYAELQDLLMGVLHALTASVDAKDPYTCGHSHRVALLSRRIAEAMGLPADKVHQVYLAGLLHDLGKIGVPEAVLCKPGRLTDEEYQAIRLHPGIGARILAGIRHLDGVVQGIVTHHERLDGRGYPNGLTSDQIPMEGRIVCLADVFDAMTSDRTYRKALELPKVLDEIRRCSGTQFDPDVVEAFCTLDIEKLIEELRHPARLGFPLSVMEDVTP